MLDSAIIWDLQLRIIAFSRGYMPSITDFRQELLVKFYFVGGQGKWSKWWVWPWDLWLRDCHLGHVFLHSSALTIGNSLTEICNLDVVLFIFCFQRLHFSANHWTLNITYCSSKRDNQVVRNERFCLIAYAIFFKVENFIFQGGEMTVVSLSNTLEISQPPWPEFLGTEPRSPGNLVLKMAQR